MDSSRTEWMLQREVLFRARRTIARELADLGGPVTSDEARRQAAADERAAAGMAEALESVMVAAGASGLLPETATPAHREYWHGRAPAVLAFGARTHGALAGLGVPGDEGARLGQASAIFQLAASLLDWIGDDCGGGAEVASLLSADDLDAMCRDAAARRRIVRRAREEGGATTGAFATLLGASLDAADACTRDGARFHALLHSAYLAELASFGPPSDRDERLAVAWRRHIAPTLVVGELATLSVPPDEAGLVAEAAEALAPTFGRVDDMADLSDDMRTGSLNTILAARECAEAEPASGADALRAILASGVIEESADMVAREVRRLERLIRDAGVDAASRAAALEWLRTTIWRWLS